MAWALLIAAGALEIVMALALKSGDGWTRLGPKRARVGRSARERRSSHVCCEAVAGYDRLRGVDGARRGGCFAHRHHHVRRKHASPACWLACIGRSPRG